ncbi:archaeosine synthase subunit alpha [Halobacterium salinarum]|uniref:archaeosine synthase subunit alpha n=1 Tax=Halobacterium salinarum TaxID=2242 RepID=UPI002554A2DC|nr:archaeosine synthase subunit alpha [Halobacterium salinarum]MDL0138361.1 archaeosine synthase subunit alpha [Halobacterium salinarum]
MTEYFEIHERDAAARVGELRLSEPVTTPTLTDDVIADAGSRWTQPRETPDGDDAALTVLPHRGFPSGTADDVQASFAPDYPDVAFPSAAVVSPSTAADFGADAYVLSGAPGIVGHGSAFADAIVEARAAIPDDTALSLSGVATPRNVAVLVYAGVDLVNADRAVVRGTQGRYLTTEGAYDLADLDELPCSCPACQQPAADFDRTDCVDHNVNALEAELARVRRRIRDGRLRDYVEGQARHTAWLTAAMRELDQQYGYVEQRTPTFRDSLLLSSTQDALHRVEIQRFADRVTSRYRKRLDGHPLLLVPCSARKPYSDSQSHRQFQDAASYRAHVASITSPIGVVPQELELTYPAQHYDSVVTGRWSAEEKDFVARVLRRYLERTDYPRVIAHVPPEGYRDICERVAGDVDVPFEFTVADHPTTDESLGELNAALAGEDKIWVQEREAATLKAVADYYLGDGAGDAVFADIEVQGRYPKLQALDADTGDQLAALVPEYGSLSFTLAGARQWVASDAPTKRVEIDGFVPQGSVLAPGVIDASDDIRVGDEVVIEGPAAFAVGRARMPGPAMADATRGMAVQVRHCVER